LAVRQSVRIRGAAIIVKGAKREQWQELCEKAANEHNPDELVRLIEQINKLLLDKEQRLKAQRTSPPSTSPE
jgi:hypothetical protein